MRLQLAEIVALAAPRIEYLGPLRRILRTAEALAAVARVTHKVSPHGFTHRLRQRRIMAALEEGPARTQHLGAVARALRPEEIDIPFTGDVE
jgi:hypothetical protein